MSDITFKKYIYIVMAILVLIFYTKDIHLFKGDSYDNTIIIDNPEIIHVLVNKKYKLPSNYIPTNLELIDINYANEGKYLQQEARVAFEKLSNDAKKEGYRIVAVSTYRTYDYQQKLYEEYVQTFGSNYADHCSARAGHSEHQTGLAIDVEGSNKDYDNFDKSKEFIWMTNNAYKYGFILRYPKGKTNITGFKYEPWHYRYVGKIVAEIIYQENLTLEEYYDKYINLN